ncbi:diphthamide synthesis protein [Candidatus Parvarchaeota archaeon]|nr:diphthamide synthesis protein [Candidatus Parvarchaeota archaeon]
MKYPLESEGLKSLAEKYELDLDRIVDSIKEKGYNKVAVQLPDGFKRHALEISEFISKNSGADVYIWGGSTYGACDVPTGLEKLGIKMIIQFGHARFKADEIKRPERIKE